MARGAPTTARAGTMGLQSQQQAAQVKRRRRRRPRRGFPLDQFFVAELGPGYNCKGVVWVGQARCAAVFDTGSTRNSIGRRYLEALLKKRSTAKASATLIHHHHESCNFRIM